jgi:Type II/IV secretion system protein
LTAGGVSALPIRRHGYLTATLRQLRGAGTVDSGLVQFLRALVIARKNILITGGTGVGKTTLRLRHTYRVTAVARLSLRRGRWSDSVRRWRARHAFVDHPGLAAGSCLGLAPGAGDHCNVLI